MRADAYAEHHKYPDIGCEVAPLCLECPLEVCVHSDEGRYKAWERRDAQMRELSAAGVTNDELAAAAGLGPRSIQRILA